MKQSAHENRPRRLIVEFTKMSGAGNDFIVIDNRFYHFSHEELSEMAERLCIRQSGIGADGLLAFMPAGDQEYDYRMLYFNADGSLGTMCGNGARCLGRFARLVGIKGPEMTFESDAGEHRIIVPDPGEGDVRLYLPSVADYRADIQLRALPGGVDWPCDYLWTGTEHVVCWVDDVDAVDAENAGSRLRNDSALGSTGANINFASRTDAGRTDTRIRSRTFEKGVEAETLACGTGAVAVALTAAIRDPSLKPPVAVLMRGGTLTVGYDGDPRDPVELYLEGPAEVTFRGTFEL